MKRNFTLWFIAIFIVGFMAGYLIKPTQISTESQSHSQSADKLKDKLQVLTDKEIAEYYELKNDSDKLKKADEILAKMMTLFLHDLGIRISKKTLDESSIALNKNSSESTIKPLEGNTTQTQAAPDNPEKILPASWKKSEKLRHEIKNEKETADFLEQVKIPNFNEALKDAKSFANRTGVLAAIQGQFLGNALVSLDEKFHTWSVDLFLSGNLDKGNFQGKAHIKMAENGKVFSNSSDNGKLQSFKEFSSESDAILIRVSPTVYFQMYFLNNENLIGNVYKRNSEDEPYSRIGTLQLKRST